MEPTPGFELVWLILFCFGSDGVQIWTTWPLYLAYWKSLGGASHLQYFDMYFSKMYNFLCRMQRIFISPLWGFGQNPIRAKWKSFAFCKGNYTFSKNTYRNIEDVMLHPGIFSKQGTEVMWFKSGLHPSQNKKVWAIQVQNPVLAPLTTVSVFIRAWRQRGDPLIYRNLKS